MWVQAPGLELELAEELELELELQLEEQLELELDNTAPGKLVYYTFCAGCSGRKGDANKSNKPNGTLLSGCIRRKEDAIYFG